MNEYAFTVTAFDVSDWHLCGRVHGRIRRALSRTDVAFSNGGTTMFVAGTAGFSMNVCTR